MVFVPAARQGRASRDLKRAAQGSAGPREWTGLSARGRLPVVGVAGAPLSRSASWWSHPFAA
jgi:hypothetical protein